MSAICPAPTFSVGQVVHTPEGTAGTISGEPRWDDADDSWLYDVDWEDGLSDTQPEMFFEESWESGPREPAGPGPQFSIERLAAAIGIPFENWAHRCHSVSLAIVRSGVLDLAGGTETRVVRGTAVGVTSQHSWIVLSGDPYDQDAWIVDATLWSYREDVAGVWIGSLRDGIHRPHGSGSIWDAARPPTAEESGEPPIALTPGTPLSADAQSFLRTCGPLGRLGWAALANCPVGGWPAAEIIAAMDDTPAVSSLVPIDVLGQITDRNPNNLYW
jgi:hypothetical protein